MQEWKRVTKQELIDFVESYPFPLEQDFYMDWYSWNDFRNGRKWPESMVAMASGYDDEFKIYDGYIQNAQGAFKEES